MAPVLVDRNDHEPLEQAQPLAVALVTTRLADIGGPTQAGLPRAEPPLLPLSVAAIAAFVLRAAECRTVQLIGGRLFDVQQIAFSQCNRELVLTSDRNPENHFHLGMVPQRPPPGKNTSFTWEGDLLVPFDNIDRVDENCPARAVSDNGAHGNETEV
jgi:hypothetical protein